MSDLSLVSSAGAYILIETGEDKSLTTCVEAGLERYLRSYEKQEAPLHQDRHMLDSKSACI